MAVEEARLTLDRMAADLESSKRLFLLSAGQEGADLKEIPDRIPRPAYEPGVTAELVRRFTQEDAGSTYAVMSYRDYIRQADLDYRIARVQLRPNVGLNASLSQQSQAIAGAKQEVINTQTYSIVANWTVFDGFAARGAKLAALSRKRSYEHLLRTSADQAILQAHNLEQQLGFSWRGLDLSQRRCDIAEAGVAGVTDDVKLGLMSANKINAARLYFYQSELTLAMARADFLNLWSQLVSALCVDPMLDVIPNRYLQDGK
jgi:outer membrane protein TolC